jgi:hypothetical protein
MNPLEKILEYVEGVEQKGNSFWALCPAHDDHKPSLHIEEADDGRALLKCRAGCDQSEVMTALERLGLKKSDLFADNRSGDVVPLKKGDKAARRPRKSPGRLVKSYTIKDVSGRPEAIHERYENDEGGKSFLWKHPDGRFSRNGEIKPETLSLYGSEHISNWPADYGIVLVEGETPAEALQGVNIRALGTVCGAGSTPTPEVLEVLRGRRVVLWADNDPGGREHMKRVGQRLRGVAASVQSYEPKDAEPKDDAADHPAVKSGNRDALKALGRELREAPEVETEDPAEDGRILLGRIMKQGIDPPEELVPDILLAGKVHSIYSGASTGKTFLMLWIILQVIERGLRVLVFDKENGPRIMAERLELLGADPAKVDELVSYHFYPELPTTEEGLLDFETHLDKEQPALVVFDSWINFLAANGLDENSSNDVSRWATHYTHPARSRNIAVLLLDHVPKEGVSSRGSSRKKDEVDVMWALRNPYPFDRDRVGRIVVQREKDREGWLPESVGFSVGGGESSFVFSRSAGIVETEDEEGLTPSEKKALQILEEFGETGATAAQWQKKAEKMPDSLKVPRRTFYRAKPELMRKQRIYEENGRFFIRGATGAKQVPRHQMAPGPEEVPLVPPPYRVAPSGTGAALGSPEGNSGQEEEYTEVEIS